MDEKWNVMLAISVMLIVAVPSTVLTAMYIRYPHAGSDVVVQLSIILLRELYFFLGVWLLAIIAYCLWRKVDE